MTGAGQGDSLKPCCGKGKQYMKESDIQRLEHIQDYCLDIGDTIERFGTDYETFLSDKDYFKSVSMSIMQIGELSAGLSDDFKENSKTKIQWGPIKAMRNLFAHAYKSMAKDAIWETSLRDIPVLLKFCDDMLEPYQEPLTPTQEDVDAPDEGSSLTM
jgi:uncharacterized protein with HEPN domain